MHLSWSHHSAFVVGTPTTGKLVTPPASQAFLHDLDGNLTDDGVWSWPPGLREVRPRSSGTRASRVAVTWDAENRLVAMQHKTTLADTLARRKLAFEYDARGRRIRRQVFPWGSTDYSATATSDQRFVYDGWNLAGVFDSSFQLLASYIWGLDLSGTSQGAGGVGGLLAGITGTTAQFAAYDGNGNVRALADGGTGAWSAQYEYGPFGELVRATGPQARANPFRFSTKWHDDDTDLLYYGYRYYQPGTGRWLGRDPIEERGGMNLYGFVVDPISQVDLLGLDAGITDGQPPSGAHTGVVVDVRDLSGQVVGCLRADYHALGYMEGDGDTSSGSFGDFASTLNEKGRVTLTICPKNRCKTPTRSITGTQSQDSRLAESILDSAEGSRGWFNEHRNSLGHCTPGCVTAHFDGRGDWKTYRNFSNNCNDYTDCALDMYLGYNWNSEIITDGIDLIQQWDERFPSPPTPGPREGGN